MRKTPTFWAAAVAVAITVPVGAGSRRKDRVKELVAQALQQAGQTGPVASPIRCRPRAPGRTDGRRRRAPRVERNLDIQVQRLEPQLLDLQVAALWATYPAEPDVDLFTQGSHQPAGDQLQALGGSANQTTTRSSGTQG